MKIMTHQWIYQWALAGCFWLFCSASFADGTLPAAAQGLPHGFDAGWKGAKTCVLLYETESVRVGKCVFPPGIGHEKHYHNPHFGYVIEGSTMLINDQTGERTVSTGAGDSWSSDVLTVHEAVNIGETTAEYLIVEPRTDAESFRPE